MKNMEIRDVHLRVKDIKASVKFYEDVLGLHTISVSDKEAKLSIGRSFLYLKKGVAVNFSTTGLYHFAILLPTEEDLGRFLHHLSKVGFYQVGAGDHIYSQALYFDDIDGNGIEVYADRDMSKWVYDGDALKAATLPVDINRLLEIGKGPWNGIPKNSKIGHIHLQVKDLANVKEVYVDKMGFDIKTEMPTALFVSKDGYHHHIGANTWAGSNIVKREDNMIGLDFFTLEVSNLAWYKEHLDTYQEVGDGIEYVDDNGIKVRFVAV